MSKSFRVPLKESYLLIIIIVGILSLCMYSSFALFSLEKTTSKDIFTMKAASDIETTLKIFEYKKITVSAGDNASVMVNVNNDTGGSIYYGVFYEMLSPSTKSDDITIAKIDWSENATSGSITNGSILPVEIIIINNSSSDITLNIGVAGSDSNELGLPDGKTLITETFDTGEEVTGGGATSTTDFSYTGAVQTKTLTAGSYKLEVWGAEGGYGYTNATTYAGGKGGYSYGTLTLDSSTNIYVYVGGQGASGTSSASIKQGGFNGGGNSGYNRAGSGGGASDIRIGEDSLYSRVIVAGGGGGGAYYSSYYGGAGGGTSAVDGTGYNTTYNSKGGTQTAGGAAGYYSSYTGTAGSFGIGGNANTTSTTYNRSGGGGGGWYGGGGGAYRSSSSYYCYGVSGGGGGSGYVYTSSTASNYPTGVKLTSTYYLTNAATRAGNTSFTDNDGTTVTGHSGDGHIRITSLVKADTTPSIDTSAISLAVGDNIDLKSQVTCNDNGTGCKIVLVKPSSSEKLTIGSNSVMYVLEDNSGNRYKYTKSILYGYYLRGYAASAVKDADDGSTGDSGSGVYKVSHSAIASGSSATGSEIPAVTDYRYYGASPDNYICLDMEGGSTCSDKHLYRIIGSIYEELEDTNRIKVIKATPLTDRTTSAFSWDYTSSGSYSNIWATVTSGNYSNSLSSGSQLMKLLNSGLWWNGTSGSYYNGSETATTVNFTDYKLSDKAKSYISTSRYYLGGYSSNPSLTNNMYGYERGTFRFDSGRALYWDGMVGLMYLSDYGYAAGNSCVTGTTLYDYNDGCMNKDWLHNSKVQWPMSLYNGNSYRGFQVYSSGYAKYDNVCNAYSVRPVFYLNKDVVITSGTGTSSDPYLVSK